MHAVCTVLTTKAKRTLKGPLMMNVMNVGGQAAAEPEKQTGP